MVGKDFNCGACRFWVDQNIIGLCKRYPEHFNKHNSDWCGEFAQKQVQVVALPVVEMKPQDAPKRKYTRRQDAKTSA